jgi:hypothetical protein
MPRYRVKLAWSVPAQAASREEAIAQVERLLREHPSTFIAGVEDFDAPRNKSFFKRIVSD